MRLGLDVRLTYYTQGGIARYVRQLAQRLPALAEAATHVHFYRRGHGEVFSAQARRVACWTPAHHRLESWALGAELWPHQLDLLHSPDFIPPRFGARRFVITVHDLAFWRYPEFLTPESRRYYNGQIRDAVRRAAAIAADSAATRDDLVELLQVPAEKITVIHLGHDPAFSPQPDPVVAALLNRLGLPRGYVLFVGTFEPRKNVPLLLDAYAQWRAGQPEAPPLVLVGNTGWLFAEAQARMAVLGLEKWVRVLENVPGADLPALYTGAGAVVVPSHYEGFGFPVLEAMGCGTPVVVSDRASLPEIAGEAALKVPVTTPEPLAEALERVFADPRLRAELTRRGLERVKAFSWDQTARATLALYQRVLAD